MQCCWRARGAIQTLRRVPSCKVVASKSIHKLGLKDIPIEVHLTDEVGEGLDGLVKHERVLLRMGSNVEGSATEGDED